MKIEIVVIVGPTAVGKSDFAVKYALENNGEIISADSRQIYKGLDIGTGKISKKEMRGIRHHLLDITNPKKRFSVEKYKLLTQKAIEDIHSRNKLPILCGGTGFYIDSVINNITYPNIPKNYTGLKKIKNMNINKLNIRLKELDKTFYDKLNNSERNNKRRLVRYIELAMYYGKVPEIQKDNSKYNVRYINLVMDKDKLRKRIYERLIKRINDGMIEEVYKLHKKGLSWKRMEELGLEYRYVSRYLRKQISKEKMIEALNNEIWHYAKRQILWFKKYQ